MKKIITLVVVIMAIVTLQGPAYGVTGDEISSVTSGGSTGGTVNPSFSFTPANNVVVLYVAGATTYPNTAFTITAKNTNGNRVFSTSNNTTSIYYQENDAWKGYNLKTGAPTPAFPDITVAGAQSANYSGWKGL